MQLSLEASNQQYIDMQDILKSMKDSLLLSRKQFMQQQKFIQDQMKRQRIVDERNEGFILELTRKGKDKAVRGEHEKEETEQLGQDVPLQEFRRVQTDDFKEEHDDNEDDSDYFPLEDEDQQKLHEK
ncbi:hypothetical protein V6N13_049196 [Hibiscus sabdariffa]|uniref:Uncharacterized protein n=1 Tax=Hibiscus sabdariffa TaxID=183260 RepID=A0ABR2QXX1_9ROSI